jgi:hypothetical protein
LTEESHSTLLSFDRRKGGQASSEDLLPLGYGENDGLVFDALGLIQGERNTVYEAVINLIEARLKKAGSI